MSKTILFPLLGLVLGIISGVLVVNANQVVPVHAKKPAPKQIIGFLPYWQLEKANPDVVKNLTTLTYFALNVDGDGHVVTLTNPQQEDPGWLGLHSDKLKTFLSEAKNNNVNLSLLISSGDADAINKMVSKPTEHAKTLVSDIKPLMKQYGFTNLNLDIEDTGTASGSAQKNFTQFVKIVKEQLSAQKLGTLTLEISTADTIKYNLINTSAIEPYADNIVLMAYDYHSPDSVVTGPVAPLNGAGNSAEYDVTIAVDRTLQQISPAKLVLGMPLYGYEWETLNTAVHSAIIPGSGVLASNNRAESMLTNCANCNAYYDNEAQEAFIVYHDQDTGTYHQITFPNNHSVAAKISFANQQQLDGVALWALGYESASMLDPLKMYK